MPIGGFRQHHTGEKRPHRHRQADHLHCRRRSEHDEQGGRDHHLARAGAGNDLEHRIEQIFSGDDHRADGRDRNGEIDKRRGGLFLRSRRKHGDQRQKRHDRQILEQQN
ncbi:hypothetical protein D3C73_909840 [compost metagenome]